MVVGGSRCVRTRVQCRVCVIKALVVFDCGDVGRLRGPAAQERELEHLIEPYAPHLDASSRTRAGSEFIIANQEQERHDKFPADLGEAVGFAAAYACRRLHGAIT